MIQHHQFQGQGNYQSIFTKTDQNYQKKLRKPLQLKTLHKMLF